MFASSALDLGCISASLRLLCPSGSSGRAFLSSARAEVLAARVAAARWTRVAGVARSRVAPGERGGAAIGEHRITPTAGPQEEVTRSTSVVEEVTEARRAALEAAHPRRG